MLEQSQVTIPSSALAVPPLISAIKRWWVLNTFTVISPVASAARQSKMEELNSPEMVRHNVLHMALGFACIVAPVAYLILALFPKLMRHFSWLPLAA